MNQVKVRKWGVRIQVLNVPSEWKNLIEREAAKLGISVSDFVKLYILKPWIEQRVMKDDNN